MPAPQEGLPVCLRACTYCYAKYYAADAAELDTEPRPTEAGPWSVSTEHLPSHDRGRLRGLVTRLAASGPDAQRLALAATATPLDEWLVPIAPAVGAVVTDLTPQGARVVVPTDRHASYWLVDFSPSGMPGVQIAVRYETAAPLRDGNWRVAGSIA